MPTNGATELLESADKLPSAPAAIPAGQPSPARKPRCQLMIAMQLLLTPISVG